MRNARVLQLVLGVARVVVERVDVDDGADAIVVSVRQRRGVRGRCGVCRRVCAGYDRGEGRRRWRHLDVGVTRCFLEADAARVRCPEHGVVVAFVPWARHDAGHTRAFDDQVAWLAAHTSKTAIVALMRIAWRTVGSIVTRVVAEARAAADPFDGLARIGIDEIAYKRGHRYLTVVVDHDSGRLVWAAPGRDKATLGGFFDLLGDERAHKLTVVSADGADWIEQVVTKRAPNAARCMDVFHVVAWATAALDQVRRETWNHARRNGMRTHAREIVHARYALWKNPEDLTWHQERKLAWIATLNGPLYRAYLLKEQLRAVFRCRHRSAIDMLHAWLRWASRCRIAAFVELARKIRRHLPGIEAALEHDTTNALVESTNTKLRLLTRIAYGFHRPDALIALAYLDRGGYCPPLPHTAA